MGNGRSTAKALRNNLVMRKQFAAFQIPQPRFALVNSLTELHKAVKKISFPGVIKPVAGAAGHFVLVVHGEEEAKEAVQYIQKNTTAKLDQIFSYSQYQFLYESYSDGPEITVEAVTQNGQTNIIAVVDRQTTNDPYFIPHVDTIPSKFDAEAIARIHQAVFAVHRAVGITNGVTHTEICMTAAGPEVIEIDGRLADNYIWDGVKSVWGVDLVEQAFRVAVFLPITGYDRGVVPKLYFILY